ncbi:hypothetical protein CHLRE_09g413123v5 [Chlamydomonas reinhardtii]|uniref:Uncharacterized protein n=1 Tax=Chlamydomonas reinhardtii TaxID=3055 RepID=A0A2K3DFT9_CHLRE|nr:uncharacterized protein CHLRE_09g413123v5 [Chlamydomonas reinhardtii]PNW79389.1 hypothetical protein CHLRE_09g413123v5 [Chlamydomonas reinhardtii]
MPRACASWVSRWATRNQVTWLSAAQSESGAQAACVPKENMGCASTQVGTGKFPIQRRQQVASECPQKNKQTPSEQCRIQQQPSGPSSAATALQRAAMKGRGSAALRNGGSWAVDPPAPRPAASSIAFLIEDGAGGVNEESYQALVQQAAGQPADSKENLSTPLPLQPTACYAMLVSTGR